MAEMPRPDPRRGRGHGVGVAAEREGHRQLALWHLGCWHERQARAAVPGRSDGFGAPETVGLKPYRA